MMKYRLPFLALIVASVVLICGCYSQSLRMNSGDMSGTVTYTIDLHPDFIKIVTGISQDFASFAILDSSLFNKGDMTRLIRDSGGITLLQHTVTKKRDDSSSMKAVIGFSEWQRMPASLLQYSFPVTIKKEGLNIRCIMQMDLSLFGEDSIIRENYRALNDKERDLIDTYAKLVPLEFSIKTPRTILQVSGASLTTDRTSATVKSTLYELLIADEARKVSILYKN